MALSLATGWDLMTRPPVAMDWSCGQLFSVDGTPPRLRGQQYTVTLTSPVAGPDGADR